MDAIILVDRIEEVEADQWLILEDMEAKVRRRRQVQNDEFEWIIQL